MAIDNVSTSTSGKDVISHRLSCRQFNGKVGYSMWQGTENCFRARKLCKSKAQTSLPSILHKPLLRFQPTGRKFYGNLFRCQNFVNKGTYSKVTSVESPPKTSWHFVVQSLVLSATIWIRITMATLGCPNCVHHF